MDIKNRIKEILNENDDLKFSLARTNGYTHSSHNIWFDKNRNLFKWTGTQFEPVKMNQDQELVKQITMKWNELSGRGYRDQEWYPITATMNGKTIKFMIARKSKDKKDRLYLKTMRPMRMLSGDPLKMHWDYYEIENGELKSSKKLPTEATEEEIKEFESK